MLEMKRNILKSRQTHKMKNLGKYLRKNHKNLKSLSLDCPTAEKVVFLTV